MACPKEKKKDFILCCFLKVERLTGVPVVVYGVTAEVWTSMKGIMQTIAAFAAAPSTTAALAASWYRSAPEDCSDLRVRGLKLLCRHLFLAYA